MHSLFATKVLSLSSGNAMDVNLEQKDCHSAFFATRSNVQGSARIAPSQGESRSHHESSSVGVSSSKAAPSLDYNSVELLEYRIEKSFLSNTEMKQGTGTEPCLDVEEAESRHYRLVRESSPRDVLVVGGSSPSCVFIDGKCCFLSNVTARMVY